MKNYYNKELEKLNGSVKVRFVSDDGETNWMALNKECCQAIAQVISARNKSGHIVVE